MDGVSEGVWDVGEDVGGSEGSSGTSSLLRALFLSIVCIVCIVSIVSVGSAGSAGSARGRGIRSGDKDVVVREERDSGLRLSGGGCFFEHGGEARVGSCEAVGLFCAWAEEWD